jgi:hypothetical protein
MKENIDLRFNELKEDINLYNEMGILPIKKLAGINSAVRTAIDDLKSLLATQPLADERSEIEFFKYLKPKFVAEQLFALEVFTIENNKPIGEELLIKAHYEQELRYIRRFFDQHIFLYQYYLLDGTELDVFYFTRGAEAPATLLAERTDLDEDFSTAGDYLFAKFIAYERLQQFMFNKLYHPQTDQLETSSFKVLCKLSVDQIGIILKACDENRVITAKSLSAVFRTIVPYLSTEKKKNLSWAAMRKSSYQFERSDVEAVIETMEKLIDRVRGYY